LKEYKTSQIRNIGLVGHGSCGKTSLAEAMLFNGGVVSRMGSTDDGSTVSDYAPDEISRRISISSSLMHLEGKDAKINILDMPGYSDFVGEVIGGLKAAETAVIVVDAVNGPEGGTETSFKFADDTGCSKLFFVNKVDKEHADPLKTVDTLNDLFGMSVIPLQLPIGAALEFKGVVDLLKMQALTYTDGKAAPVDIPADMAERAASAREKMMEAAAEADDALLEKFFDSGELSDEDIIAGLRTGMVQGKIAPVLFGSAIANIAVDQLVDYISSSCPSPADKEGVEVYKGDSSDVEIMPVSEGPPNVAYVFKTISVHHVGEISLFKVVSGSITNGSDLVNPRNGTAERLNQIFALNGKNRREVNKAPAGDIAATVKLKETHTCDTLCDKSANIMVKPAGFPNPLHRMAIVSLKKGDEDKISSGLAKLHEEDPAFFMKVDPDIKQTIIFGQGEMHLDVQVARLRDRYGVDVELTKPKIPYRETIQGKSEAQGKFKRQSGGRGQYGDCWLRLEPLPRGEGFEFVDAIVGGVIPSKFIPAVEKGILEAMGDGEMAGCRVVDLKATCYDGSYHDVDSSEMAFKIAASMGFKKAFMAAKPVLLEPIYNVNITVPDDFTGDVMGDISSRRGKIQGMEPQGKYQLIKAQIPLAELHKYSTALRSLTQGRGTYSMEFSHYEETPHEIQEKIIAEHKAEKEGAN
jgi:elongation factor G